MANTMPRSLRIPEDVWRAAVVNAKADGTSLTTVLVAFLRRYNAKHKC